MQSFHLHPKLRLRVLKKGANLSWEQRPFLMPVSICPRFPTPFGQHDFFYVGFESFFGSLCHFFCPRMNRACSIRSIANGVMHLMPRPMQASGILIFLVEPEATSCV